MESDKCTQCGPGAPPEYRLRIASEHDEPLLFELFCTARAPDFSACEPALGQQLLQMQYRAQRNTYQAQFPLASRYVIEDDLEVPIGSLLYEDTPEAVRLIDIAILPAFRNRGIGTSIIEKLQQAALKKDVPVCLSVFRLNPARVLYLRLGFTETDGNELYQSMQWKYQSTGGLR